LDVNRQGSEALYRVSEFKRTQPEISSSSHAENDAEAELRDVFLRHYPTVVSVLLRITGDHSQAEELANEVFWRFARKGTACLLNGNIGGWLYRAAVHAGLDALRASSKRLQYERAAALSEQAQAAPDGPLDHLLREEERRKVRGALSAMKPERAQLLIMRAGGASYREISEMMQLRVGSVGTLLNRAEADFKKRYLQLKSTREEKQ
jgi:RNA polymerase sigma-70 factor (ECF subfamily)